VKTIWSATDNSDIGAGVAIADKVVVITNTGGWVKAYNTVNGKTLWSAKTGGKIYGTPAISGNMVMVTSTDKYLYCLDKNTGKIKWKAAADKPLVGSPVINGNSVFCGGSDGHFRCYELSSGKLKWDFEQVPGFVATKPLLYNGCIYFGSWGNRLFALDQKTGAAVWQWNDGYSNRMFSPAACVPVATGGRLFVVAPDRYMTCFNAATGEVIWRKGDPKIRVREAMGLSADSSLVYVKTMEGDVLGMSAVANTMEIKWKGAQNMGYDISPSLIQEHEGLVFALSNSGMIYAFNRKDGSLAWMHKVSNCLVNPISFLKNRELIATTMDGKIVCLKY
jgi:outer membrane protein assembly factor BamB